MISSHTLNEFDTIYNQSYTQEEFVCLIRESIDELKQYILVNESSMRKVNKIEDVIQIVKSLLPVARVCTDENMNHTESYELYFYNPIQQCWVMNDECLKMIIIEVCKVIKRHELRDIKLTLQSDYSLPLINLSDFTKPKIVNGLFDTYINFKNGRYYIVKDELVPHKPSMISTNVLPYNYESRLEDEYENKFDEYFKSLASDNQSREKLLKQVYFAMLLGYNPEQKAINLYGPAGSGKSTYINAGIQLAGGNDVVLHANYGQIGKDDFLTQIKSNKIIAGLDNEDGVKLKSDLNTLKSILSQESFSYSVKYSDPKTNLFRGLLIQAFNVAPDFRSQGSSQPIVDRMIITEINQRFRQTSLDNTNLKDFFKDPKTLSQLATYIIKTVPAFNRYEQPDEQLSEDLIVGQDSLTDFVEFITESYFIYSPAISRNHLYSAYQEFCGLTRNEYQLSETTFFNRIEQHLEKVGLTKAKNNQQNDKKYRSFFNQNELTDWLDVNFDNYYEPKRMYYYSRQPITLTQNLNDDQLACYLVDRFLLARNNKDTMSMSNYQKLIEQFKDDMSRNEILEEIEI